MIQRCQIQLDCTMHANIKVFTHWVNILSTQYESKSDCPIRSECSRLVGPQDSEGIRSLMPGKKTAHHKRSIRARFNHIA